MKLYNTLTRQIEEFEPLNPPEVSLYACGPTVYDYAHLGHLRKYTMDDVIIRVLKHAGYKVKFVQNVTDVGHLASDGDTGEDKLEKGAKKYGQSVWDIAKKFEDYFFTSMDEMGNLRPDISCRATEHIKEQLKMVLELEKKGYTYVIEGDGVYFDTSKLDDYGKLARLNIEKLKEGARLGKVKGKKNPTDFALWKFEREGENRAMVWESPWHKRSFPGWHIECSAMSMKYLGEQMDIHTGGIDHIPVHHTNEIAQSEAATGKKPFVKYWVHHNFLRVDGEKMSKSLGNFFTIEDVKNKGFSPQALRLLFLTSHYRSEQNFTWKSLEAAQKSWERLVKIIRDFKIKIDENEEKTDYLKYGYSTNAQPYKKTFFELMGNDLKTPEAIAVMWEVLSSDLPAAEKLKLLFEFDEVLGLGLKAESEKRIAAVKITTEVSKLLKKRKQARKDKDWAKSDELRDQIQELGFIVVDESDGEQTVKLKS